MSRDLVEALALGYIVADEMLVNGLYEICDDEHAHCNNACPVYRLNGGSVPDTANDFNVNRGCDCFKNGTAMLKFIREVKS